MAIIEYSTQQIAVEKSNKTEDPYLELANAIVYQAVKDYRKALQFLAENPESAALQEDVREHERFFRSSWYRMLTEIDGEYLISVLRREAGLE